MSVFAKRVEQDNLIIGIETDVVLIILHFQHNPEIV